MIGLQWSYAGLELGYNEMEIRKLACINMHWGQA